MKSPKTFIQNLLSKGLSFATKEVKKQRANTIHASLDEMVFEQKEKRYGAYLLRKNYPWHLMTALAFVGGVFLWGCLLPVWMRWIPNFSKKAQKVVIVDLEKEIYTMPEPILEFSFPPSHHDLLKPKTVLLSCGIPEPIDAHEFNLKDPVSAIDSIMRIPHDFHLHFDERMEQTDTLEIPETIINLPKPATFPISMLSNNPVPLNMSEIQRLIGFPQIARDAGITGRVILEVKVNEEGNYVSHQVVKDPHPILTKAVEKHIGKMKFELGYLDEEVVSYLVTIPFNFACVLN